MIVDAANDRACLDQATTIARQLVIDPRVVAVAQGFVAKRAARADAASDLRAWMRAQPQRDDDGKGTEPGIACDVPQRIDPNNPAPNCVERAVIYTAIAENIDPTTSRRLVTATDGNVRHTTVGEQTQGAAEWTPVDLTPTSATPATATVPLVRNAGFDRGSTGETVVKDVHAVGKGVFGFFGGDAGRSAADVIGDEETQYLIDKNDAPESAQPSAATETPPPKETAHAQDQRSARAPNPKPDRAPPWWGTR